MTLEILGAGKAVTELDIRRLEKKISIDFPLDYRSFLLRNNGGRPVKKYFKIHIKSALVTGKILDFFGIDDPVESCSIEWNYNVYKGRIPSGFFPIGCEDGGNIICMQYTQPEPGAVYYWNHDLEGGLVGAGNPQKISGAFDEFLENLTSVYEG